MKNSLKKAVTSIISAAVTLMTLTLGASAADAAQWRAAVEESYETGAVLEYTVYDAQDSASVTYKDSCPNDDASEWNVYGIEYMGVNYGGSPTGGIKTNITRYVENGDRLRVSFEYRSGYMGINPFIEVKKAGGETVRYELDDSGNTDVWKSYESNETAPIELGEKDSVSLVIMNETGFWHIRSLKIERFGGRLKKNFLSGLHIDGVDAQYRLEDGKAVISGSARDKAVLYAALYKDGRLKKTQKLNVSGSFRLEMNSSGADTIRLFAWDEDISPCADMVYVNTEGTGNYREEAQTLKDKYADKFLIGNIYNTRNLFGTDKEMLLKNFNVITAENIMKPESLAPQKGVYNWSNADQMVDFAEQNGMEVIGHVLVWHQQTPEWFTTGTKDEVYAQMEDYIHTVVGRYKGRLKGWDVVNEAIRDADRAPNSWSDLLRKTSDTTGSAWYKALNDAEYIYNAFVYAHEADPDAELYYNDYNLDSPYKSEAAALLVKHVNDKYKKEYNTDENLIDAVGMQAHYNLGTNTENVRASVNRFREIGVKVNISELDVCLTEVADNGQGDTSSYITLTDSLESRQAAKYAELMSIYEENSDIIERVTFWGCSDGTSWRSAQYPTLFNSDLTPKKAYYGVMDPQNYR